MIDKIFKLTEIGFDCMFTDEFWGMTRYRQSVLLTLYGCFLSEQDNFSFESIENILNKKNLIGLTGQEFRKLCNELKGNKEACKNFVSIEFN